MARSKVFVPSDDGLVPLASERAFERQRVEGRVRLAIATDANWTSLMRDIAFRQGDKFACRYEEREIDLRIDTRPLDTQEVTSLTDEAAEFLESDPRHNFSLRSADGKLTVVLDEHNFLLVYGDLEGTAVYLSGIGFAEGTVALPTPHVHKDLPELDATAAKFRQLLQGLR